MIVEFKIDKEVDKRVLNYFLGLKRAGKDFSKGVIEMHPELKKAIDADFKEKRKIISDYVERYYKKNMEKIKKNTELIKKTWSEIEEDFFKEVEKLFELNRDTREKYTAYAVMTKNFPRYIEDKIFTVGYEVSLKFNIRIICHELLHFFFYDYIDNNFPDYLSYKEKWTFSEIFNLLILNLPEFKKFIEPCLEEGYPIHRKFISKYETIYNDSDNIRDFFEKGIELTKKLNIGKVSTRLGVLFSGGKDSVLALAKTMEKEEIVCLISIISKNKESYMFHTPNINLTKLQAEAMDLPIIQRITEGEKEEELEDLREAISDAKKKFKIEGIVTGAIESVYQSSRIRNISEELGLECLNPLWHMDPVDVLKELIKRKFEVIITGVFAEPFDKDWIGRKIDNKCIEDLENISEKYKINPAGEGGEIETMVVDAPFFKKRIKIKDFSVEFSQYSGTMKIKKAVLEDK